MYHTFEEKKKSTKIELISRKIVTFLKNNRRFMTQILWFDSFQLIGIRNFSPICEKSQQWNTPLGKLPVVAKNFHGRWVSNRASGGVCNFQETSQKET